MRKDIPQGPLDNAVTWGSDVAAQALRRLGIRYISMNPGASYRGFHDSLVNHLGNDSPSLLLCLHEDHVVGIAHGYAKATGEPMACILHSNVGLMHGMMMMYNAWVDRMPMMVIGATGPMAPEKRRPWVDWVHTSADQAGMVRDIVKFDSQPSSIQGIIEAMCRGHGLTRTAPQAPVYISLDAGLQESPVPTDLAWPDFARLAPPAAPAPSEPSMNTLLAMLHAAKRPLILFGRGGRAQSAWDNRVDLAERLGACVVTELRFCAVFPTDHPAHVAPPMASASMVDRTLLADADLILALDWPDLGGTLQPPTAQERLAAKVVGVTLDHHLHNGAHMVYNQLAETDLTISADADATVEALLQRLPEGKRAPWSGSRSPERRIGTDRITVPLVAQALRDAVKEPADYAFSSICKDWPTDIWPIRDPLGYFGKDGGGGIGAGPSLAIGVALALQDQGRKTMAFLGDGDFIMGVHALWTAVHHRIPLLVLVNNNRSYYNDELHQETVARQRSRPVGNRWIGLRIDDPALDLAGLARAQGAVGIGPVQRVEDVAPAIAEALAVLDAGGVCVVDLHIDAGEERAIGAIGRRKA